MLFSRWKASTVNVRTMRRAFIRKINFDRSNLSPGIQLVLLRKKMPNFSINFAIPGVIWTTQQWTGNKAPIDIGAAFQFYSMAKTTKHDVLLIEWRKNREMKYLGIKHRFCRIIAGRAINARVSITKSTFLSHLQRSWKSWSAVRIMCN